MTPQNKLIPMKRVTIYCDGCKTSAFVELNKEEHVAYCPSCGGCGIVVEKVEWLRS